MKPFAITLLLLAVVVFLFLVGLAADCAEHARGLRERRRSAQRGLAAPAFEILEQPYPEDGC